MSWEVSELEAQQSRIQMGLAWNGSLDFIILSVESLKALIELKGFVLTPAAIIAKYFPCKINANDEARAVLSSPRCLSNIGFHLLPETLLLHHSFHLELLPVAASEWL